MHSRHWGNGGLESYGDIHSNPTSARLFSFHLYHLGPDNHRTLKRHRNRRHSINSGRAHHHKFRNTRIGWKRQPGNWDIAGSPRELGFRSDSRSEGLSLGGLNGGFTAAPGTSSTSNGTAANITCSANGPMVFPGSAGKVKIPGGDPPERFSNDCLKRMFRKVYYALSTTGGILTARLDEDAIVRTSSFRPTATLSDPPRSVRAKPARTRSRLARRSKSWGPSVSAEVRTYLPFETRSRCGIRALEPNSGTDPAPGCDCGGQDAVEMGEMAGWR